MAQLFQRRIDNLQNRRCRAETAVQRQVAKRLFRCLCQTEKFGSRIGIIMRAGALKAEDRLFEIANREQGPVPFRIDAYAGKKFAGQRPDDIPLRDIGILRLVDQDVIGTLVELVADPRSHIAFLQEPSGHPDHVVKIHDAVQALGVSIAMVESASGFQCACEQISIFEQDRFFEQAVAPLKQRTGNEIIVRQRFQQPFGWFWRRPCSLGGPGQMNIGQASSALLRIEGQPEADRQLPFLLLLATRFGHRIA